MFILPVLFAALGASGAAPYPDDFVAHCSHGQETRVYVNPDWSHSMQQKDNGNTYRVDIRRENGQFIVWSLGPDYQIGMANGEDWKLDVPSSNAATWRWCCRRHPMGVPSPFTTCAIRGRRAC